MPITLETPGALIESNKTASPAADPEIARRILDDAVDVCAFTDVPVVARSGNIVSDLACFSIDLIEGARKQAYPQNSIGIS